MTAEEIIKQKDSEIKALQNKITQLEQALQNEAERVCKKIKEGAISSWNISSTVRAYEVPDFVFDSIELARVKI